VITTVAAARYNTLPRPSSPHNNSGQCVRSLPEKWNWLCGRWVNPCRKVGPGMRGRERQRGLGIEGRQYSYCIDHRRRIDLARGMHLARPAPGTCRRHPHCDRAVHSAMANRCRGQSVVRGISRGVLIHGRAADLCRHLFRSGAHGGMAVVVTCVEPGRYNTIHAWPSGFLQDLS
jgi:hypothetical protein